MKYYLVGKNKEFIDRENEIARLKAIKSNASGAHILVVYGRRRAGKTELNVINS